MSRTDPYDIYCVSCDKLYSNCTCARRTGDTHTVEQSDRDRLNGFPDSTWPSERLGDEDVTVTLLKYGNILTNGEGITWTAISDGETVELSGTGRPTIHALPNDGLEPDPAVTEVSGTGYATGPLKWWKEFREEQELLDEYRRLNDKKLNAERQAQRAWNTFAHSEEVRITDPETGGEKGSKPQRMGLLPWDTLMKVSTHYDYGTRKYADRNWERGYKWSLTFDSLMRHLALWWQGEETDEDGRDHLDAAVFHALALRTFTLRGTGTDDRPTPIDE